MIEQNHEYFVSLEIAKLLKQAGFDWPCNHAICCDSMHYPNLKEGNVLEYNYLECSELMEGKKPHMLLCPTLDVAQRWLREVKNVVLLVDFNNDEDCKENERYGVTIYIGNERIVGLDTYPTYEEAQEAGEKKVLEILLEKGE